MRKWGGSEHLIGAQLRQSTQSSDWVLLTRMSARLACFPANIWFWAARPLSRRCSRAAASCIAASAGGGGAWGVRGRSAAAGEVSIQGGRLQRAAGLAWTAA